MLNVVVIMGRLTAQPELRTTGNGISVSSFSVAVDRSYQSGGERQTDFINCVAWRKQAENISKYCTKGTQVAVEGRIQTSSYTDANGNNRQVFDILVESVSSLEPASKNDGYQPQPPFGNGFQPVNHSAVQSVETEEFEVSEDDLPF